MCAASKEAFKNCDPTCILKVCLYQCSMLLPACDAMVEIIIAISEAMFMSVLHEVNSNHNGVMVPVAEEDQADGYGLCCCLRIH